MRLGRLLAILLLVTVSVPAQAAKIFEKDDMVLNLGWLMQAQMAVEQDKNPAGDGWGKDFFIRRNRFLFYGNLNKNISFFFETDQANWGKEGDWSSTFFVQDAFASFKIVDEFIVDVGMLLAPFTHHTLQGAIGLNTVDYHLALVKYPMGKVWRDMGVQFRGYALDKKLHYRLAILNGAGGTSDVTVQNPAYPSDQNKKTALKDSTGVVVQQTVNPDDMPRFIGTVRYNIMGTEDKFFFNGINFADSPIISVGVAGDFQPDAIVHTARKVVPADPTTGAAESITAVELANYMAFGGDVFVDYPLDADNEIVFQANFVYYDQGEKAKATGWGLFAEAGYRWRWIEPVVAFEMFKSDALKDAGNWQSINGGLNFWIVKHNANVKVQWSMMKTGADDSTSAAIVQGQFFF